MTPSSDQSSSTPTPIDPDMHLTPTPQSTPTLPATPTMNTHSTNPQDQAQEMVNLKQIWSGVSFKRSNNETVSYVRIQVHPRTALAWNQVTQTPSLPISWEARTRHQRCRTHVRRGGMRRRARDVAARASGRVVPCGSHVVFADSRQRGFDSGRFAWNRVDSGRNSKKKKKKAERTV